MRPIYLAQMDRTRPVVLLTREPLLPLLTYVTVAPIARRIRGIDTEVLLSQINGIDSPSVINCDNITTIPKAALGREVGFLTPQQEIELAAAISHAFDLAPAS